MATTAFDAQTFLKTLPAAGLSRLSVVCQKNPGAPGTLRANKCLTSGIIAPGGGPGPTLQAIASGQVTGLPPATVQGQQVAAGSVSGTSSGLSGSTLTWLLIGGIVLIFFFKK